MCSFCSFLLFSFLVLLVDELIFLCRINGITANASCHRLYSFPVPYTLANWMVPATTQEECQNYDDARFGCQLYGYRKELLWIKDEDKCSCRGVCLKNKEVGHVVIDLIHFFVLILLKVES